MKKLILVLSVFTISMNTNAQTDSATIKMIPPEIIIENDGMHQNREMNKQNQVNSIESLHKDGVIMHNGKMMTVKNGQMSHFERDITMSNGTKIRSDGTCIYNNGKKSMMKEGQHMDMSGNISDMKNNKNMYLVPDSTIKRNK
jgi:hypothetical protein